MNDLAVVGGGPVGLATAAYATRAGLAVTVFEPRATPIDKACGEGLMPGAMAALADLGVDPEGVDFRGIRYVDGARAVEAPFRTGPGRGVRRTVLQTALRDLVTAPVLAERVTSVRPLADGVEVDGRRFSYVVAADGLHSPVRRLLGLDAPAGRTRRFGIRVHVPVPPWTDVVEVHWSARAEAYVTPVGPDCVGIALLSAARLPFDELLADFPALSAAVRGVPHSRVLGAGPLRQRSRRRVAGRVLLAGDASGYVDALTGEGIALGLAHARAAVDAITAGDPARYERAWWRASWRYQLLTHALVGLANRPTRRAVVPLAAAAPWLFRAAVNELGRG